MDELINTIICADVLKGMDKIPNNSIDCVITSPPYWQLRDYGYDGQWGLEPTFEQYLKNLWNLMDEIHRVLKNNGTVWINLGDTYGTQSGNMRNPVNSKESNYAGAAIKITQPRSINKSLLLIPHRFAIGCMERGWIVRNDIVWAKRNAMPESVTDRFSKKHEYFFFMTKSEKYYFDLDAVRDSISIESVKRELRGIGKNSKYANGVARPNGVKQNTISKPKSYRGYSELDTVVSTKKGKNPGSVSDFWDIPTKNNNAEHYASYNDSLIAKPILSGCPENGIILDPFMGTGSTAEVAIRAGRNFIGIDASIDYCNIAKKRIEPFFLQTKLF